MPELKLRSLYPEDIDQVSQIESSLTGSPRRAFLEKRLAVAAAMPSSFITCAVLEGKSLAGYGFARILEGEFGARSATAELDAIGVHPEYQGKGTGKMVMASIEQQMKKKNIPTLLTQLDWSNYPMIRFFASTGLCLAPGQIIERDTSPLNDCVGIDPVKTGGKVMANSGGGRYDRLQRKPLTVRPLESRDLAPVDRVDARLTGMDRSAFYAAKFREILDQSGIQVSMVAEDDGIVIGFIIARADFGEFGNVDKAAVIESIGVHPAYAGSGIGQKLLSQMLINLSSLQVRSVRTKIEHENFGLRNFLTRRGFKPSQRLLLAKNTA